MFHFTSLREAREHRAPEGTRASAPSTLPPLATDCWKHHLGFKADNIEEDAIKILDTIPISPTLPCPRGFQFLSWPSLSFLGLSPK